MSRSSTFHNNQGRPPHQVSTTSLPDDPPSPREDYETPGDDKDEEIARLKRAYHEAVKENSHRKASAKTNT
jgi:hypothetical protein